MTGRERILATLAGERPDRVPFVPNVWQWFHVNRERQTLPEALRNAASPLDALRFLQAEVMSKFDGLGPREDCRSCEHKTSFENRGGPPPAWTSFTEFGSGDVRHETLDTPHGRLTHSWQYEPETGAPFETAHWWKDFDREYAAIRFWMDDAEWHLDRLAWERGLANVGDEGIVLLQLLPTPLKKFHWLAGQEQASLFLHDHPDAMRQLARVHEEKSLAALEEVVDLPGVCAFEVPDNLDSQFYTPALFREFCLPVLQKSARMIHARGNYLFVHACGRLKALAPLFLEAELDCVEGQAHPPLGDWRLDEARALSDRLIICGGMTAHEQEWSGPGTRERIRRFVRDTFDSLGELRRVLFASGCNTSPRAPWENLVAFRDACWEYGQHEQA